MIKELGMTGLKVSAIGLGLAALGRPGYINIGHALDLQHNYQVEAMEQHCHQVLDCAWEQGVRYFDVARSYGRGEEFLASWLKSRTIDPGEVTIGSKWGYTYTASWQVEAEKHEVKDHTLPVLRRQIQESMGLLGNYLKLYQIHSATLESGVLSNEEVLGELALLKKQGIRIGLSLSGPKQSITLEKAMELRHEGDPLFDCVQATWNLLERSAEHSLEKAHQAGMGVIIKEALANGRLTARNQDPQFQACRQKLEEESARLGTSIDGLALAAVLARPWVDVVLSGAARGDHLTSNLKARNVVWDQRAEENLFSLMESSSEYWQKRQRLAWN